MTDDFEPVMDLNTLERMQTGEPLYIYTKTTVGRVGVTVFNPITSRPEDRILSGDPSDAKANKEEMLVKIYDEPSHLYFKNINKKLLEDGKIAPYTSAAPQINMINAITDEEIDRILSEPYLTLKNAMDKFTSYVPVERILIRAIELNKPTQTVENLRQKVSELQAKDDPAIYEENLKKYYSNLGK